MESLPADAGRLFLCVFFEGLYEKGMDKTKMLSFYKYKYSGALHLRYSRRAAKYLLPAGII